MLEMASDDTACFGTSGHVLIQDKGDGILETLWFVAFFSAWDGCHCIIDTTSEIIQYIMIKSTLIQIIDSEAFVLVLAVFMVSFNVFLGKGRECILAGPFGARIISSLGEYSKGSWQLAIKEEYFT